MFWLGYFRNWNYIVGRTSEAVRRMKQQHAAYRKRVRPTRAAIIGVLIFRIGNFIDWDCIVGQTRKAVCLMKLRHIECLHGLRYSPLNNFFRYFKHNIILNIFNHNRTFLIHS